MSGPTDALKAQFAKSRLCFFDCDGVIFDSNGFKLAAMLEVLSEYSAPLRERMHSYWRNNGGLSRRAKFEYFFREMVGAERPLALTEQAVERFGRLSLEGYTKAEPLAAALQLARALGRERVYVTSGAEQQELRKVFARKQIDLLFAEVLGSPQPKQELVLDVLQRRQVSPSEALLIGDGARDYQVCQQLGLHFVYLAAYSEWDDARRVLGAAAGVTWMEDWPSLLRASGVA